MAEIGSYDYVICGAGSAGCLLANRLSADPSISVLLLEAGGNNNYHWVHIPVGYLYCIGNPRTDWCYNTEADAGLNGRKLKYPRGKLLGGCSSINGMIYMRGQAADYDGWRQMGNQGWAWDDILPYFRAHEHHYAGGDDMHGANGELRVEQQRLRWDILDAFQDAAEQYGVPKTTDFNLGNNLGSAPFEVTQRKGWRWSAVDAFLKPIKTRSNLTILTGALIDRVEEADGRFQTVHFRLNNKPMTAHATHEIILSAGAVGSPAILQRSGIGDGAQLQAIGLGSKHHLPGVGANLQDHLQLRLAFKVSNVDTLNARASTLFGKAKIAAQYALTRSGPMSMAPSQLGMFVQSDSRMATPDLQYHVQPLSLAAFGGELDPFPAFTASVCNLRPQSRGTISIASPDPEAAPHIAPNYLSAEADRKTAAKSIRITREIVRQPALAAYRPDEIRPGGHCQSESDLVRAAGEIGTTIFHPVGTARMGHDEMAVVDDRLRLHGARGLRIIDASIMPTITSGNTNAPTMMIAEKGAAMLIEDRRVQA